MMIFWTAIHRATQGAAAKCKATSILVGWLIAIYACAGAAPQALAEPAATDLTKYLQQGFVLVRNTDRRAANRIDLVLYEPGSRRVTARLPTGLQCERVHLAANAVFCLGLPGSPAFGAPVRYRVTDLSLREQFAGTVQRGMTVSRARVAPDGAYAAATTFVNGHAYTLGPDAFATEALIVDLKQRSILLPTFDMWTVMRGDKRIEARGINFWGVSFSPADADRFYVTAALGNTPYLGQGSLRARRIDLIKADIECPSLSPDGTRLAFKKRKGRGWVPAVLDLATMKETVYADNGNVDDQIEWLDADTLMYEVHTPKLGGAKTDIVTLDVRQLQARAQLWLADAGSPAVLRKGARAGRD